MKGTNVENYSALSRDRSFQKKTWKIVLASIALIAIIYGVILSVEFFFGGAQQEGTSGSSYANIEAGVKAWSQLLDKNGFSVEQQRGKITMPDQFRDTYYRESRELTLTRETTTLVVLGGALPVDELTTVKKFVRQGGRLITDNPNVLEALVGQSIVISSEGSRDLVSSGIDVQGMEGIEKLEGSGIGSFSFSGTEDSVPLVIADGDDVIVSDTDFSATAGLLRVGLGDVVVMPDYGMVMNAGLSRRDNALFALRIAGSQGSDVIFAEGVHGYDSTRGFAGFPMQWKIAFVGLFATMTIFLCSQGRRFGVGEQPHRSLGPRRIFFAHALATALHRSKGHQPRPREQ